jgi:hypothetical protein
MTDTPRKPRRWLAAAIAASISAKPTTPFARQTRIRRAVVTQPLLTAAAR